MSPQHRVGKRKARGTMAGFRRGDESAERICTLIAEGYTLRQVAREMGLASAASITEWARSDDAFAVRYARAKQEQMDHFAEEIVAISDDGSNDWMVRESDAGEIVAVADHEHIQRSKLRVDTRRWIMAKMAPKRYGERVLQMHSGADGNGPVEIAVLTPEERQAKLKVMIDDAFAPRLALPKPENSGDE